jgi:hypothetical protein
MTDGRRAEHGVIRSLGTLHLEGDVRLRPKPLLLLVFLGLEGPTNRARLASLFCSDAADPADALATALRRARAGLADAQTGSEVATTLGSDALVFRNTVLAGDDERAVAHYRGPFLDGLTVPLGADLEEWCFRTREDLAALAVMAHLRLARAALAGGSRGACLRHASDALRHAPAGALDESQVAALRRVCRDAELALPGQWAHAVGASPILRRHAGATSRRSAAAASRCYRRVEGWELLGGAMAGLARDAGRGSTRSRKTSRGPRHARLA